MKKVLTILLILSISTFAKAQLGISYHQSLISFIGVNYEIEERFMPELRIGTNQLFENTDLELTVNYLFYKTEIINAYGGLGGRINLLPGAVIPVGANFYPFQNKSFGFHTELAALIGENPYLRGSFGIRYRFLE
jgi:hypothetical protein